MKYYLKNINASNEVSKWFEKRIKEPCDLSEQEHIADFFVSGDCPKRFERMTYNEALKASEKWIEKLNKQAEKIKELKKDTKVELDFKDGFKFVRLVGENAYKREGKLMRHCISSYFGKKDEIYSLRDKKNNPHCTISKRSKQIKGKGNGSIHPKYIKYVVEFLEYLKVEVRDSEMKNLGYVNIENFEDENAVFPNLFRGKYFYKGNIKQIIDKNGKEYQSLTLWGLFNLFDFDLKLNTKFNFSIEKSTQGFVKYFKKSNKKNIKAENHAKISAEDHATISAKYNATISAEDNATISAGDRAKISAVYYAKIKAEDYAKISAEDHATISAENHATISAGHNATISAGYNATISAEDNAIVSAEDYATISAENYATILVKYNAKVSAGHNATILAEDHAKISAGDRAKVSARHNATISAGDNAKVELKGINALAIAGKDSKMKGVIGAWIVLTEYDKNYNIIAVESAKIDGKKIKEDTWYKLENKKFVEVENS